MSIERKIKDEIIDPEYENIIQIKTEPTDLPEELFDDSDNEILNDLKNVGGIDIDDDLPEIGSSIIEERARSRSPIEKEIERLTKTIERRKKKLAESINISTAKRSLSRSRSSSLSSIGYIRSKSPDNRTRRRSRSPIKHRIKREKRSISRERNSRARRRRSRSRSRSGRKRSRSRTQRTRSRSRSRDRRTRSRSNDRKHRPSRPRLSFLDELAQTFAKKGQPFPEKAELESLQRKKKELVQQLQNETINPVPSTSTNYTEYENLDNSLPKEIDSYDVELNAFMKMIKVEKSYENYPEVVQPPLIRNIKVEKSTETPVINHRLEVLNLCEDAAQKLKLMETNPLTSKFFFTPTMINCSETGNKYEYQSPLNRNNNVEFNFNSTNSKLNPKKWGLVKLSHNITNISRLFGYDVTKLMNKLSKKNALLNFDNTNDLTSKDHHHTSFFTDVNTQTDDLVCNTCIIRQLRKYADKSTQIVTIKNDITTQTQQDNDLPILNIISTLNTSQLLALNDFAEAIKGPMPQNPSEVYHLREKLMDIFNSSQRPSILDKRNNVVNQFNSSEQYNNSPTIYQQIPQQIPQQMITTPQQYVNPQQHMIPPQSFPYQQQQPIMPTPEYGQQLPPMRQQGYPQVNRPNNMMPRQHHGPPTTEQQRNLPPQQKPPPIRRADPRYQRTITDVPRRKSPPPPPTISKKFGRGGFNEHR